VQIGLESAATTQFSGIVGVVMAWKNRALLQSDILRLTADPMLPFRRKSSTKYFISSALGISRYFMHYQKMRIN
jgi:hypothetical protein